DKTLENTLNIMEVARQTCPVYRGCDKPLVRTAVEAGEFHGKTGLDGPIFEKRKVQEAKQEDGIDAMIKLVIDNPDQITIVSVGPLTDLALAMQKEVRFASLVKQIIIMGGSFSTGNVTDEAEFNTYADPEAAQLVFSSKAPLVLFSLDCTRTVTLDAQRLERYRAYKGRCAQVFCSCMDTYSANYAKMNQGWPQMHDPLCIAYLVDPSKCKTETQRVIVDTKAGPSYGKTTKQACTDGNAVSIAHSIDIPWFWSLVEKALKQLP
ncbi:MAG: nucleoside hydrolase, partial [Spirochaetia bacterium]|nr:nucleoside hydrolase [Spirochaetia bacterium]